MPDPDKVTTIFSSAAPEAVAVRVAAPVFSSIEVVDVANVTVGCVSLS